MRPKIQASKILYSGFFELKEDLLEKEDGSIHSYACLATKADAVAILAQDQKGRYILNLEYRHPIQMTVLGPPGGRLEPNEDPLLGAQRELLEETGYFAPSLILLGVCYPIPGIADQKIYYIQAKEAEFQQAPKLDPFEFIQTVVWTEEELKRYLQTQSAVDGNLCSALWYKSALC